MFLINRMLRSLIFSIWIRCWLYNRNLNVDCVSCVKKNGFVLEWRKKEGRIQFEKKNFELFSFPRLISSSYELSIGFLSQEFSNVIITKAIDSLEEILFNQFSTKHRWIYFSLPSTPTYPPVSNLISILK